MQKSAGWAFLAASVLGAANTFNAYHPTRLGRRSILSFPAGQLTSELPLHAIAWQGVATARFIRRGSLRTKAGRAGALVTLGSWMALAKLFADANRTKQIAERALVEGLGPDYRQRMLDPEAARPGRLNHLGLVVPRRGVRRRYVANKDVVYGEFGRHNHLDIWRHPDLPDDADAPVLVQVHGGAWTTGSKRGQARPLLTYLTERGWVCVAINYRLGPRNPWPDQIVDVLQAIAWVRASIMMYGGAPNFLAITGGSAGGHLAALAGLAAGDADFQPGFEEADTSIQAVVSFYGMYDFTNTVRSGRRDTEDFLTRVLFETRLRDDWERWERASPTHRVRVDSPPFFVVHGTNDSVVPVEQGRRFVRRLQATSANPVVYVELPGAQHAFDTYGSLRTRDTVRAIERFLDVIYGEHLRRRGQLMSGHPIVG
jgi:acetyl esterase/lipase